MSSRPGSGPTSVMRSSSSSPPGWRSRTSVHGSTPASVCTARDSPTGARSPCTTPAPPPMTTTLRAPLLDPEADAAAFEEWRPLLFGISYRMLGSAADAEDVVQEAFIRWTGRRDELVQSVRSYLVTIVTRLCLDQLDSARAKRVTYAGPWLPE